MDSTGDPLPGATLFAVLLLIDFIIKCFQSALEEVPESFLEDEMNDVGTRVQEHLQNMKDEPRRLNEAGWFYMVLTAVPAAVAIRCTGLQKTVLLSVAMCISAWIMAGPVPSMTGKKYSHGVIRKMNGLVRALMAIAFPFTAILSMISNLIVRLFGINPRDLEDEVTEDDIIEMVNEGHEQGVLDEHETEMIHNIFELDDKEAQDVMTHRKDIAALSADMPLGEAIAYMSDASVSRFPVYDANIDNIMGIVHFKDAVKFHNMSQYDTWPLRSVKGLVRPVRYIPETRNISMLFRSMQAQKEQMVIVVDEYGETAGLVTMEDILEEIVGNLMDEYDVEEKFIIHEDDHSFIMAGMTPLEDVEKTLDIELDTEDYDTLNGYLVSRLDRIPEENEHSIIQAEGWNFRIMSVESKTIRWVRVSREPRESEENNTSHSSTDGIKVEKKE